MYASLVEIGQHGKGNRRDVKSHVTLHYITMLSYIA